MFANRTFAEVMAAAVVLFCVIVPALIYEWFWIKAGAPPEFPGQFTIFMGAASTLSLGLLGLQGFLKPASTTTSSQ
jgi:hypothetical protein